VIEGRLVVLMQEGRKFEGGSWQGWVVVWYQVCDSTSRSCCTGGSTFAKGISRLVVCKMEVPALGEGTKSKVGNIPVKCIYSRTVMVFS
jgi:hypothetical protein